jgi:hypothetical protein
VSDPHDPTTDADPGPDPGPGPSAGPTAGPDGRADAEEVGGVGEEAAKLLGALSDWARDATGAPVAGPQPGVASGARWGEALSGLAEHAAAKVSEIDAHVATGSATCSWCPVCRTAHAVRRTSPEVRTHLATAASSFLQAMVGLLATVPPPDAGRRPGAGVERIDLDDPDDEDHP